MTETPSTTGKTQVPWVTLSLIFLNLVASLLSALDRQVLLEFSFNPSQPSILTAFTSLFLHANVVHLLGNMVFLAAVGPRVESVAGRLPYAVIYVGGGLLGVVAHLAMMRSIGSVLPLLGASGAIASCAGYCAVRFMNRRVPLAPKVTATVGTVTLIWVGLQALGAFVKMGGESTGGTAFWTHLAGFFSGLVFSLLLRAPNQAKLQFGHDILDKLADRGPGAMLHAAEMHLAQHPGDSRALREKATALHQMGERAHEVETLIQLLEVVPSGSQAHVLSDLAECGGLSELGPIKRLRLAEEMAVTSPTLAKQLLRTLVDDPDASEFRSDALLALVPLVSEAEQTGLLADLETNHGLDHAAEVARARGLIR